jgi:Transcriptional regulator PadR-like family
MSAPLIVLGLLEREPSHGYDLKRDFGSYFGPGRPLRYGQVYATLSRLAREGKAVARPSEQGAGLSGLVLALFITTVAVTLVTTENAKTPIDWAGPAASGVLVQDFTENVPVLANGRPDPQYLSEIATSAAPVGQLRQIDGVLGIVEVYDEPNLQIPASTFGSSMQAGVVSCAQLAEIPGYGRCPAGAVTAAPVPEPLPVRLLRQPDAGEGHLARGARHGRAAGRASAGLPQRGHERIDLCHRAGQDSP